MQIRASVTSTNRGEAYFKADQMYFWKSAAWILEFCISKGTVQPEGRGHRYIPRSWNLHEVRKFLDSAEYFR